MRIFQSYCHSSNFSIFLKIQYYNEEKVRQFTLDPCIEIQNDQNPPFNIFLFFFEKSRDESKENSLALPPYINTKRFEIFSNPFFPMDG